MNSVFLSGNIGADVEVQTSGETDFVHLSIATDERVPTGEGFQKRTTWTRVTAFNGLARSLACLGKGSRVVVTAYLKTTTAVREGVEFTHSEVIAKEVEFQRVRKPAGAPDQDDAGEGSA